MAEQRYQAVLAVISDGLSVSQVAEKVGVSRQTLHTWLARYEVWVALPWTCRLNPTPTTDLPAEAGRNHCFLPGRPGRVGRRAKAQPRLCVSGV